MKKQLEQLTAFSEHELAEVRALDRTVFYPFSGPDFITVYTLFPGANQYVLFGLEPEGRIPPDLTSIPQDRLKGNLSVLQNSLADILTLSFFKTIDMAKDFKAAELDGTTPATR
jgi:hypothetical protein